MESSGWCSSYEPVSENVWPVSQNVSSQVQAMEDQIIMFSHHSSVKRNSRTSHHLQLKSKFFFELLPFTGTATWPHSKWAQIMLKENKATDTQSSSENHWYITRQKMIFLSPELSSLILRKLSKYIWAGILFSSSFPFLCVQLFCKVGPHFSWLVMLISSPNKMMAKWPYSSSF